MNEKINELAKYGAIPTGLCITIKTGIEGSILVGIEVHGKHVGSGQGTTVEAAFDKAYSYMDSGVHERIAQAKKDESESLTRRLNEAKKAEAEAIKALNDAHEALARVREELGDQLVSENK